MTAFLIDEMLPPAAAPALRRLGHDALHVSEVGLTATADRLVAAAARSDGRALVTENVADSASETDLVLLFVLKRTLASGGAMADSLALLLDRWSKANPDPYLGAHWPT